MKIHLKVYLLLMQYNLWFTILVGIKNILTKIVNVPIIPLPLEKRGATFPRYSPTIRRVNIKLLTPPTYALWTKQNVFSGATLFWLSYECSKIRQFACNWTSGWGSQLPNKPTTIACKILSLFILPFNFRITFQHCYFCEFCILWSLNFLLPSCSFVLC